MISFIGFQLQTNLSLYTISALLILDSDGARVLAKYYAPPHQSAVGQGLVADFGVGPGGPGMGLSTLKEQKAFEKSIWEKVKRGGGEFRFLLPLSRCIGGRRGVELSVCADKMES